VTYPLAMRNPAIEAEAEAAGVPAYKDDEYPVALNEAQERQMTARGWEPVLVPVTDLSALSKDELTAAVDAAGLEAPPKAKKEDLARTLTKARAEVAIDTTQQPPAVVVNPTETKE
jgi:hypothetical protein